MTSTLLFAFLLLAPAPQARAATSLPHQQLLRDLDSADPMVRLLALQGLADHVAERKVRERVIACLSDPAYEIRSLAVVTLGPVLEKDLNARAAIVKLFAANEEISINFSAMEVLWPWLATDPTIRDKVLSLLRGPIRDEDDLTLVDQAVITVTRAQVVSKDAAIRAAVLRILSYDDSWWVSSGLASSSAAEALAPLCRQADVRAALEAAALRGVSGARDALASCR
ncbi:MAG: hypothetical protein AAB036_10600 [Elusimicrobiota bacterium]